MGGKRHWAEDASVKPPAKKHQGMPSSQVGANTPKSTQQPTTQFLENPKGEELKREVQLYEQLTSEDSAERLQAGDAIVSGLLSGNGVTEAVLTRHLERRLFRGLASGRKAARLGFSMVLTEILGQLFSDETPLRERYVNLTFEKLLDILVTKTKPQGDMSGQEERDHAFGLLFGLQCFVRAKMLFQIREGRWEKPLEILLQLAEKKTWMREECGWIIVEALPQMEQKHAEDTVQKLYDAGLASTPEGVGLWLVARERFPGMNFPAKPWGEDGNPLEHMKALSRALRECADDTEIPRAKQSGHWNPKLHFVWHLLADILMDGISNGDTRVYSQFECFWKVVVDENLFSASASLERKYWGFQLFQKLLLAGPKRRIINVIFSQNLMRSLINHLSKKDRFLFRAADRSVKVICEAVQADPDITIPVLSNLISGHGTYNFDQTTKTKTVYKLISQTEGRTASGVVQILRKCALEVQEDSLRQILGDYILSMIRRINFTDETMDISWVKSEALPTLAFLAYCKNRFNIKPELSEKSRTVFRNRLVSAFAHLMSHSQGFLYPCDLLLDHDLTPDAIPMDGRISAAGDEGRRIMKIAYKKARKSTDRERKLWGSLSLLYSLVIFQLYNGEADAVNLLGELKLCCDALIERSGRTEFSAEASVVLVEILLSLVSKPSALFRKVAEQVFTVFCNDFTEDSIRLMTDVLGSKENLKGQEELFDRDEQDDEQDGEQDEEQDGEQDESLDLDSDVELVSANKYLESGGDEDESEDGENNEGEEEGSEEALQKLDDDLAKALGTHPAHQDINAESSDDDTDMTDSEMMTLDAKLVEIFSQRKKAPNKKEKKGAKENIINFKNRVLDLLEIYARKCPGNPLAYSLLQPLLQLIRTTTNKQVGEKAQVVINTLAKSSRGASGRKNDFPINIGERLQLLEDIHAEAAKNPALAFARTASVASLLIASSIYRADKHCVDKIASVYHRSEVAWLRGKVRLHALFFHGWVNWCQSHATL